ncbi:MAG: hypothetical protein ACXWJB_04175 [Limisphaerales bacterium]
MKRSQVAPKAHRWLQQQTRRKTKIVLNTPNVANSLPSGGTALYRVVPVSIGLKKRNILVPEHHFSCIRRLLRLIPLSLTNIATVDQPACGLRPSATTQTRAMRLNNVDFAQQNQSTGKHHRATSEAILTSKTTHYER